eukprot:jgi/Mesvir1/18554/Mv17071-RA.1
MFSTRKSTASTPGSARAGAVTPSRGTNLPYYGGDAAATPMAGPVPASTPASSARFTRPRDDLITGFPLAGHGKWARSPAMFRPYVPGGADGDRPLPVVGGEPVGVSCQPVSWLLPNVKQWLASAAADGSLGPCTLDPSTGITCAIQLPTSPPSPSSPPTGALHLWSFSPPGDTKITQVRAPGKGNVPPAVASSYQVLPLPALPSHSAAHPGDTWAHIRVIRMSHLGAADSPNPSTSAAVVACSRDGVLAAWLPSARGEPLCRSQPFVRHLSRPSPDHPSNASKSGQGTPVPGHESSANGGEDISSCLIPSSAWPGGETVACLAGCPRDLGAPGDSGGDHGLAILRLFAVTSGGQLWAAEMRRGQGGQGDETRGAGHGRRHGGHGGDVDLDSACVASEALGHGGGDGAPVDLLWWTDAGSHEPLLLAVSSSGVKCWELPPLRDPRPHTITHKEFWTALWECELGPMLAEGLGALDEPQRRPPPLISSADVLSLGTEGSTLAILALSPGTSALGGNAPVTPLNTPGPLGRTPQTPGSSFHPDPPVPSVPSAAVASYSLHLFALPRPGAPHTGRPALALHQVFPQVCSRDYGASDDWAALATRLRVLAPEGGAGGVPLSALVVDSAGSGAVFWLSRGPQGPGAHCVLSWDGGAEGGLPGHALAVTKVEAGEGCEAADANGWMGDVEQQDAMDERWQDGPNEHRGLQGPTGPKGQKGTMGAFLALSDTAGVRALLPTMGAWRADGHSPESMPGTDTTQPRPPYGVGGAGGVWAWREMEYTADDAAVKQVQELFDLCLRSRNAEEMRAQVQRSWDLMMAPGASNPVARMSRDWVNILPKQHDVTGGRSNAAAIAKHLEDKQARHRQLLRWLSEMNITLPDDALYLILSHGEKLAAMLALRRAHNALLEAATPTPGPGGLAATGGSGGLALQAMIEVAVKGIAVARGAGAAAAAMEMARDRGVVEEFYAHVSSLERLFVALRSHADPLLFQLAANGRVDDTLALTVELMEAIAAALGAVDAYRQALERDPWYHSHATHPVSLASWAWGPEVRGGLGALAHVCQLLWDPLTTEGSRGQEGQGRLVLLHWLMALSGSLLDRYRHAIDAASTRVLHVAGWGRRRQGRGGRTVGKVEALLPSLLRMAQQLKQVGAFLHQYSRIVDELSSLAERHTCFWLLSEIFFWERREWDRLYRHMIELPPDERDGLFATYMFRQLRDKGTPWAARLLQLPDIFSEMLASFLKEYPGLGWLHQLRLQEYVGAQESLALKHGGERAAAAQGKGTHTLKDAAYLLSLQKLALLAAQEESPGRLALGPEPNPAEPPRVDAELACLAVQRQVSPLLAEGVVTSGGIRGGEDCQLAWSPAELLDKCLGGAVAAVLAASTAPATPNRMGPNTRSRAAAAAGAASLDRSSWDAGGVAGAGGERGDGEGRACAWRLLLAALEVFSAMGPGFKEANRSKFEDAWQHLAELDAWGRLADGKARLADEDYLKTLESTALCDASQYWCSALARKADGPPVEDIINELRDILRHKFQQGSDLDAMLEAVTQGARGHLPDPMVAQEAAADSFH